MLSLELLHEDRHGAINHFRSPQLSVEYRRLRITNLAVVDHPLKTADRRMKSGGHGLYRVNHIFLLLNDPNNGGSCKRAALTTYNFRSDAEIHSLFVSLAFVSPCRPTRSADAPRGLRQARTSHGCRRPPGASRLLGHWPQRPHTSRSCWSVRPA